MCVNLESILELNFLHKQPLRSLCVTLDGGLTSKVCSAEGQPLFTQEKRVFWVEWPPVEAARTQPQLKPLTRVKLQQGPDLPPVFHHLLHLCCEYTQ